MLSWIALAVSLLAGLLVGIPVGRWVTRLGQRGLISQRYARAIAEVDGFLFGTVAGLIVASFVSVALVEWLIL